jgi:hypothetical protein
MGHRGVLLEPGQNPDLNEVRRGAFLAVLTPPRERIDCSLEGLGSRVRVNRCYTFASAPVLALIFRTAAAIWSMSPRGPRNMG